MNGNNSGSNERENDIIDLCSSPGAAGSDKTTSPHNAADDSPVIVLGTSRQRVHDQSKEVRKGRSRNDGNASPRRSLKKAKLGCHEQDGAATSCPNVLVFLESGDAATVTDGLVHALGQAAASQANVYTCTGAAAAAVGRSDDSLLHVQQDDKWSCGFRNAQMLLSSLVAKLPSTHAYFGHVPAIMSNAVQVPSLRWLQAALERCWHQGFDAAGAAHYQHRMVGRQVWIGAMENASLLTYLGIDATVLQFMKCDASRRLLGPVCTAYFGRSSSWCGDNDDDAHCPHCSVDLVDRDSRQLAEWCLSQAMIRSSRAGPHHHQKRGKHGRCCCDCSVPPLYLQWQGHSVTIVGVLVNDQDGGAATHLLVLDPRKNGSDIATALLLLQPPSTTPLQQRSSSRSHHHHNPVLLPLAALRQRDCQVIVATANHVSQVERERRQTAGVCVLTAAEDAVKRTLLGIQNI